MPMVLILTMGVRFRARAPAFGLDLREYWRIVLKRKKVFLSIIGAVVLLSLLYMLMQTPLYTSTVRLQIDYNIAKIVEGGNITSSDGMRDYDFLKTQQELLQSRAIAERVASSLKLGEDADFLKKKSWSILGAVLGLFRSSGGDDSLTKDAAAFEAAAAAALLGNRKVSAVTGSRLDRHQLLRSGAGPRPKNRRAPSPRPSSPQTSTGGSKRTSTRKHFSRTRASS